MNSVPKLCVNVDHVATVRQARREREPDPVAAAKLAEKAGAAGITAHLREDRRHIQDLDVLRLRRVVRGKFNLEMAGTAEMLALARRLRPDEATLVPEKRRELTTEGGLDVVGKRAALARAVESLSKEGITVSLFVDAVPAQVRAAAAVGAAFVELHTGPYAHAWLRGAQAVRRELLRLRAACLLAHRLGLGVNLGHGLTYANVGPICALPHVEDLNIGHNIVARATLVGMERAVKEMLAAMRGKTR
jgi:pyridoxine 5-phosphate synthase